VRLIIKGARKILKKILEVLIEIIGVTLLEMNRNLIIKIKILIITIITPIMKALINLKMNPILTLIKILIFKIQVIRIQMQLQTHHLLMKNLIIKDIRNKLKRYKVNSQIVGILSPNTKIFLQLILLKIYHHQQTMYTEM